MRSTSMEGQSSASEEAPTGRLRLVVRLCDRDNRPYLLIKGGELRVSPQVWDITNEGTLLTFRDGLGQVRAQFECSPKVVHLHRAHFWSNGYQFRADEHVGLYLVNDDFFASGITFQGAVCGFYIGPDDSIPGPWMIRGNELNRFGIGRGNPAFATFLPAYADRGIRMPG